MVNSANGAIYEPTTLWDKTEINICFYDNSDQINLLGGDSLKREFKEIGLAPLAFNMNEKNNISKAINKEFQFNKTRINFVGWQNCSDSAEIDAIVMKAGKTPRKFFGHKKVNFKGFSSIGENGTSTDAGYNGKNHKFKPFVVINTTEEAVIVHEFGHLAGLRHEHIHPNAKRLETTCQAALYSKEIPVDESVLQKYDKSSIMNYCRIFNKYNTSSALSSSDAQTLFKIYDTKN